MRSSTTGTGGGRSGCRTGLTATAAHRAAGSGSTSRGRARPQSRRVQIGRSGDALHDADCVSEPGVCRNWRAGATEQTFRMRGVSPAPLRAASSGRIPPTCRQGEVGPDSERVSIVFCSELTNENPPNACDCHRDGVSGTLRRVPPPPIAFCLDSLWVKSQN